METELGIVLLQRSTRRVALTHAGELFWARVCDVLEQLEAARGELDELSATLRGSVRIAVTPLLGSFDLPAALAAFRRRYPGVAIALRSGLIAELLAQLDAAEVDLVLGPARSDELPPRYLATRLVDESLVLITAPGHRLAADCSGLLSAARNEPFVCLEAGSGLWAMLTAAAAAEGFVPSIAFETYSPTSIRELVAAGLGVGLIAASAVRCPGPPVEIYPLNKPPRHPPISVITNRAATAGAAQRALRTHLIECCAATTPPTPATAR